MALKPLLQELKNDFQETQGDIFKYFRALNDKYDIESSSSELSEDTSESETQPADKQQNPKTDTSEIKTKIYMLCERWVNRSNNLPHLNMDEFLSENQYIVYVTKSEFKRCLKSACNDGDYVSIRINNHDCNSPSSNPRN